MKHSDVLYQAWSRGFLKYKLFNYQVPLYDSIMGCKTLKFVLNCSRRYGKSSILCLIALETALRLPDQQIRFAAPTGKALRKSILPLFKMFLKDCPVELAPKWNGVDGYFKFNNGSEIHLSGTDAGHAENLRGQASHLNIIDEAADIDNLDYVYRSVLLPQTLTTQGKTILASTPPKTPAHDFYSIAIEAMAAGEYAKYTIWDNKSLNKKTIDTYAKESGGYGSTHFKREYECEFVVDQDSVIIPEWKDEFVKNVEQPTLFQYFHKYVGMDLGVKDFTACIFGYYDFERATLVIEDEFHLNGPSLTTQTLANAVQQKEQSLWGSTKPYRRISDNNNLLLIQDLSSIHSIKFIPTNKESLDAMVNTVRILVGSGKLEINPKCKQLIGCLKHGIWSNSKSKREFARSTTYGHFDHLAALIYLIRNLDTHSNPIPNNINYASDNSYIGNNSSFSQNAQAIKNLFRGFR